MSTKHKKIGSIVTPGLMGNVLEWYDFALYGYFASVLAPLFFPTEHKTLALITTFAVFAIGFIMRPAGAILFGYFGDRYGRKNSLAAAVLLMAIPTTLIGCLPTYAHIGISASLLLIFFRLLQGLAVGGEFTGSIVYIIEHVANNRRGLYGSLVMGSAFVGLLLGSGTAALTGSLAGEKQLMIWAWRIPFLLSFLLGIIGLYLRLGMPESPIFIKIKQAKQTVSNPLLSSWKIARRQSILAIGMVALTATLFYISFVYLPTYFNVYLGISIRKGLEINTFNMILIIIMLPFFGSLSDKIGRKPLLQIGSGGVVLFSLLLYWLMNTGNYLAIIIAQSSFAVLVALYSAATPATLVELFPTPIRYTGLSLPYNIANSVFGGTAPLIATALIYLTGSLLSPSYYLMCIGLLASIAIYFMPETYQRSLKEI